MSCTFALLLTDPLELSFDEAINEPWLCKAMDEELQAIKKNEAWDFVELPKEKMLLA